MADSALATEELFRMCVSRDSFSREKIDDLIKRAKGLEASEDEMNKARNRGQTLKRLMCRAEDEITVSIVLRTFGMVRENFLRLGLDYEYDVFLYNELLDELRLMYNRVDSAKSRHDIVVLSELAAVHLVCTAKTRDEWDISGALKLIRKKLKGVPINP